MSTILYKGPAQVQFNTCQSISEWCFKVTSLRMATETTAMHCAVGARKPQNVARRPRMGALYLARLHDPTFWLLLSDVLRRLGPARCFFVRDPVNPINPRPCLPKPAFLKPKLNNLRPQAQEPVGHNCPCNVSQDTRQAEPLWKGSKGMQLQVHTQGTLLGGPRESMGLHTWSQKQGNQYLQ